LNKFVVLNKIINTGIIAVIRTNSKNEALEVSKACINGGIKAIEVTFTVKDAEDTIRKLSTEYQIRNQDVAIGAGTVLDSMTARIAILAGAQFIVSPSFDEDTAKLCNLYQIPYIPGCLSITEIKEALEAGADIIKLFPGSAMGPKYIKDIKGPLPQVNIIPTGGISLDNVEQWIENGCIAVGVGGNLTTLSETGDYDDITEYAKQYINKIRLARSGKL
jgi:2-dehydro-3-deoxyphosphogluconate aldolase/(4S)-4-hydroxy-2-oxoglutarate aldolase